MITMTGVGGITAYPGLHSHDTQSVIPRTRCIRAPPKDFVPESLPPSKISAIWHYGVRVVPVLNQPHEIPARTTQPYEIWRRWEDSLDLQKILVEEYERLAELKIQRLVDESRSLQPSSRAASFDSLPSSSNRVTVQTDFHHHVPKLSKKSNLFRNSSTLIDNRAEQLASFLTTVFESSDELLLEARGCRRVCDWFGWWKGDNDAWTKLFGGDSYSADAPLPINPTISLPEYVFESGSIKVRVDTLNPRKPGIVGPPLGKRGPFSTSRPSSGTSDEGEIMITPAPSFPEPHAARSTPSPLSSPPTLVLPGHQPPSGKYTTRTLRTKPSLPSMPSSWPHESHSPTTSTTSSSPLRSTVSLRTGPIPRRPPPPGKEPPPLPLEPYTTSTPRPIPSHYPLPAQYGNVPMTTAVVTRDEGQQKELDKALPPSITLADILGTIPAAPNTTPPSPSSPLVPHALFPPPEVGRARSASFGAPGVRVNRSKPVALKPFDLGPQSKAPLNVRTSFSSPTSPGGLGRTNPQRRFQPEVEVASPIVPHFSHTAPPNITQFSSDYDPSFSAPLTQIEDHQEAEQQYASELRGLLRDPTPTSNEEEEAHDLVSPSTQILQTNGLMRESLGARPFVTSAEVLANRNARVIMLTPSPTPSQISLGIRPPSSSSGGSIGGRSSEEFAKQFEVVRPGSSGISGVGDRERLDDKFSGGITMICRRSKSHAHLSGGSRSGVGRISHRQSNSLSSVTSSTRCVDLQHLSPLDASSLIGMSAQALASSSESSIPVVFPRGRSMSGLSSNAPSTSGPSSMVERLRNFPKEMGLFVRSESRTEGARSPRHGSTSPSLVSNTELGYMVLEEDASGEGVETNVSQTRPMSAGSNEGSNDSGSSRYTMARKCRSLSLGSSHRSSIISSRAVRGSEDEAKPLMQYVPAEEEVVDPYLRTLTTDSSGGIISLTVTSDVNHSSYTAPNSPGSPKKSHYPTPLSTHFESEQSQPVAPGPSPTTRTPRQFHLPSIASQASYPSSPTSPRVPTTPIHSLRQLKSFSSFRPGTNSSDTQHASTPTTPSFVYAISLKILHEPSGCAVMLRVPRTISFLELRERISRKFEDVESLPAFAWDGSTEKPKKLVLYKRVGGALTRSPPLSPRVGNIGRSRSASTASNAHQETLPPTDFVQIDSEEDWTITVSNTGEEKMSLRIREQQI